MQQSWKDHKISLDKPSIESGAMLHFFSNRNHELRMYHLDMAIMLIEVK